MSLLTKGAARERPFSAHLVVDSFVLNLVDAVDVAVDCWAMSILCSYESVKKFRLSLLTEGAAWIA